jgi:hypothetical protein
LRNEFSAVTFLALGHHSDRPDDEVAVRRIVPIVFIFALRMFSGAQEVQFVEDPSAPSASIPITNAPSAPSPTAPLTQRGKFKLFVTSSVAPGNFLGATLEAGLSQRDHNNLGFGQGAAGFGGRFGAAVADRATFNLLALYALPTALKHEPRFLPQRNGSFKSRAWRATLSPLVAHKDSGGSTFNTSVVLGAFAAAGLSNAYYPESERGALFTARSASLTIGSVTINNLAREFWPDIKRKVFRRN